MNLINRTFSLFLWIVLTAFAALAAPLIPFQKGTAWIYEGTVEWQEAGEIRSEKIRLTTEIIETFINAKTQIAVVRNFPPELVQYQNRILPRYSILIETGRDIYQLSAEGKIEAQRLARKLQRRPNFQTEDSILFYPLVECAIYPLHIKGLDLRRKSVCVQSLHRTNPDIEVIDFAPGFGIIRYFYNHFGTTASVKIELKEVRFPKKIDRRGRVKGNQKP